MKSNSHRTLGIYLSDTYLQGYSTFCRKAFSFGCIQPDKNPLTYLKGSIRCQWLRGHNWDNANKYIKKLGDHLQHTKSLHFFDFYRLGKLIHYTADAFTYAHNIHYTQSLSEHRSYECKLHYELEMYLARVGNDYRIMLQPQGSVSDFIRKNHARYMCCSPCLENDMEFSVRMCAQVLQLLLQSKNFLLDEYKKQLAKSSLACYSMVK